MTIRKMALLTNGVITNIVLHKEGDEWGPLVNAKDITDRIHMNIGRTYVERAGIVNHNLIIEGNSLAAASKGGYNCIEQGALNAGILLSDIYNVSLSGRTTVGCISVALNNVDTFYRPSFGSKNIYVLWEGTNDLFLLNSTAAEAYARIKECCKGRRVIGYKTVVGTILPRIGDGVDQEDRRIALNELIRNGLINGDFDAVADVGGDALMGDIRTCDMLEYYYDKTHLSELGHNACMPYFRDAIALVA